MKKELTEILARLIYWVRGRRQDHALDDWLRAEKFLNIFPAIVIALIILAPIILGESWLDKLIGALVTFFVFGISFQVLKSILEGLKEKTNKFKKVCILIAVLTAFLMQVYNIISPVVISEKIELSYNLNSEQFKKTGLQEFEMKDGIYELKRITGTQKNLYEICTPYKIKQVALLFTSYDKNGQHLGRMTWDEATDYTREGNCIKSCHQLNESFNEGQGRHIIVYSFRQSLVEFLKKPTKALVEYF